MRVCDHCGALATTKIVFEDDHQSFDLCESGKQLVIAIIQPEKKEPEEKKRGRKKDE